MLVYLVKTEATFCITLHRLYINGIIVDLGVYIEYNITLKLETAINRSMIMFCLINLGKSVENTSSEASLLLKHPTFVYHWLL